MATKNSIGSNIPIEIAKGGTNAASMATSLGILKYNGTSLVTSAAAKISASDVMTNTSQPSFYAHLNGVSDTNSTGNGVRYKFGSLAAPTITLNRGSCLSATGVFTVPVSGVYLLNFILSLSNLAAGHTGLSINLATSGYIVELFTGNPFAMVSSSGLFTCCCSMACSLTAAQTFTADCIVTGGTQTVTVVGSTGNHSYTSFSGCLLC